MAQLLGVSTVLLGLVTAALQPIQPLLQTSTIKSASAFGNCLTAVQEEASLAWAFMPSDRGGTFTNSGSQKPGATYWLTLHSSEDRGEIRLFGEEGARPSESLIAAVNQCR